MSFSRTYRGASGTDLVAPLCAPHSAPDLEPEVGSGTTPYAKRPWVGRNLASGKPGGGNGSRGEELPMRPWKERAEPAFLKIARLARDFWEMA